jgi:DNA-directed RNA polymerase subunit alpha
VTDIVLNLKGVVCRMHSDATEIEAPLVVTGPGEVTAKDIDLPSGVEVLNPDAHIATLEKKTKLELYLTIGRGRGYRPAEENKSPDQPIGVIPIDSIFSPVRRVAYAVEQARVGQRTDFDKLDPRHRDRRLDRPAGRAARGSRDPHLPPVDLHRRGPDRGAAPAPRRDRGA